MLRHELIGLDIAVVDARNQSLIGLCGRIVAEGKDTLTISTEKGEKVLLKKLITIRVVVSGEAVLVEGKYLQGRPEDRIKK